eukprot:4720760-Heterocapsa_arctica.AAC.1
MLGWTPAAPASQKRPVGKIVDVTNVDQARLHLRYALKIHRWRSVGTRRVDFGGAADGIDEG